MPAINDKPCRSIRTKGRVVSTAFKDVPACWGVNSEGGSREVHPAGTSKLSIGEAEFFASPIADSASNTDLIRKLLLAGRHLIILNNSGSSLLHYRKIIGQINSSVVIG